MSYNYWTTPKSGWEATVNKCEVENASKNSNFEKEQKIISENTLIYPNPVASSLHIIIPSSEETLGDSFISITDVLDEIHGSKEPLFIALEKALEHIRVAGGNCYELLTLFWHQRKRMNEIAEIMGYTNGANTKHQKSRCQERLRVLAYNELNS